MATGPNVVIATLQVDEKGAVRGIQNTDAALTDLGKTGKKAGTAFVEPTEKLNSFNAGMKNFASQGKRAENVAGTFAAKMFDLKGALIAVAGSIGLVFILLQVGLILRDLVGRVLESSEGWQTFKTALDDTFRSMVLGETVIERLTRKVQAFMSTAGVVSGFDAIEKGVELVTARIGLIEQLGNAMPGAAIAQVLRSDLAAIELQMAEVVILLQNIGLSGTEIVSLTGAGSPGLPFDLAAKLRRDRAKKDEPTDLFAAAGILSPQDFRDLKETALQSFVTISKAFNSGTVNAEQFATAIENIVKKLKAAGATRAEIEAIGLAFGKVEESIEDVNLTLDEMARLFSRTLRTAVLQFDILIAVANTLAASIAQAFSEGGITVKQFIADMLRAVGQALLAYGALALVMAFLGYGPGFAAAGIALVAGAAAFAAAAALDPGSGAPAGGNQAVVSSSGGSGRITPNVSIFVQGSLLGTSTDELAREITDLVRRGQSDGAVLVS